MPQNRVTVVTSFGPAGYELYGKRFLDSFERHWPRTVDLVAYVEDGTRHPRAQTRMLWNVEGCTEFISRHYSDPSANGMVPAACWSRNDIGKGRSYRTNAVKFCRKPFAVRDAARRTDAGILVWIDADVVTTAPVPADLVERVLQGRECAYLGRKNTHSECGFLAFRLPHARNLIEDWAGAYQSDEVFRMREQHDSYVFDVCRERGRVRSQNMTPEGRGHVWFQSPLGQYMDHLKGEERKQIGASYPARVSA